MSSHVSIFLPKKVEVLGGGGVRVGLEGGGPVTVSQSHCAVAGLFHVVGFKL